MVNEWFGREMGLIEIFRATMTRTFTPPHHKMPRTGSGAVDLIGQLTTKDESQYPMIKVRVVPASGGYTGRVAAE